MTPLMTEDTIDMTTLAPGRRAVVSAIEASSFDALRLVGLGICEGRTITIVKSGNPLILRVYGRNIGLSARLAHLVRVDPIVEQAAPVLSAAHAGATL